MEQECSGCAWISEEIGRLKCLLAQFERQRDHRLAQIASEAIASLARDWEAHVSRDHATEVTAPPPARRDSIPDLIACKP